ncbi:MAG: DUF2202 domain-containing protein [Epsilonproteobacteria bacterium]|nr:DUF2202 domain-containing protein [Campylobacterota bacterium]
MKKILTLGTISTVVSVLLIGCGSSSDSDDSSVQTGYFIDSPVAGAEYKTSSGETGTTDNYGRFNFKTGDNVKFYIGKLNLGEAAPDDKGLITPDSLANGDEDTKVLILRVLQSLDVDNDPSNGITIPDEIIEELTSLNSEINISSLESDNEILAINPDLANELDEDYDGSIDVTTTTAEQHYEYSLNTWEDNSYRYEYDENSTCNQNSSNDEHGQNGTFDINSYPLSTLTQDLKDAISYMGNEERLAHDVYINLYNYHSENSALNINQLKNIAERSETTHVQTVQSIVKKYNLSEENLTNVINPVASSNTAFEDLPIGVYDIPAIQNLYNVLYEKGIQSEKDALEVGCMVEVTDINDLNERITMAQESNATDILDAFTVLRDASYNHYWAFDKGLQNIGIENGCCSLGEINGVNYCHTEYPQNEHENDSSQNQEQGQEQGQGRRYGRN